MRVHSRSGLFCTPSCSTSQCRAFTNSCHQHGDAVQQAAPAEDETPPSPFRSPRRPRARRPPAWQTDSVDMPSPKTSRRTPEASREPAPPAHAGLQAIISAAAVVSAPFRSASCPAGLKLLQHHDVAVRALPPVSPLQASYGLLADHRLAALEEATSSK